jgi:nucleotide-binding universal stress UspA family protein
MLAPKRRPSVSFRQITGGIVFDKVLVGVDGRSGGRDAIVLAQRLVRPGGQMMLAHVCGDRALAGRGVRPAGGHHAAAETLLMRERRQAGVEAELVVTGDRAPGRALQGLAEGHGADLMVVGSSHRGAIGRVLLGDDSLAALSGSPCAVAIAPAGYGSRPWPIKTIGVGSDGSPESELALQAGRELASRHGSALRALAVVSLQSVPSDTRTPPDWTHETERVIEAERERLLALEGVDGEVVYGDPSEELHAFADQLDLLIVGSRSNGPLGRLLNGSTSTYLARRAPCPLLVLPRTLTASEPAPPDAPSPDPPVPAGPRS